MRRSLWSLLALFLAIATLAPAAVGLRAEREYANLLGQLNQPPFKLLQSDYQRGWFSSRAEARLELGESGERIHLVHRIYHGPLPRVKEGILAAWIETDLRAPNEGESTPLRSDLTTRIRFDHTSQTRVAIPDRTLRLGEDGTTLTLREVKGALQLDPQGAEGSVTLSRLALHRADSPELLVEGLRGEFQVQQTAEGDSTGTGWTDVAQLTLYPDAPAEPLTIFDFSISGKSETRNHLTSATSRYRASRIAAGERQVGPAELHLSIRDFATQTLAQRDLPAQQGLALLADLFASHPRLAIEQFYLETPDGEMRGNLELDYPGESKPDPSTLIHGLRASGQLRIAGTLLKSLIGTQIAGQQSALNAPPVRPLPPRQQIPIDSAIDRQIRVLEQLGFIRRQQRGFVTQLSLEDGQLTINGRPLPLELLLGSLAGRLDGTP